MINIVNPGISNSRVSFFLLLHAGVTIPILYTKKDKMTPLKTIKVTKSRVFGNGIPFA